MPQFDAMLRHRELTQELYDIGDEVAQYIDNVAEAIADFDEELVADCMAELDEIVDEARSDSRRTVAELFGLRQALTSGVRSGTMSVYSTGRRPMIPRPDVLDGDALVEMYPLTNTPVIVSELSGSLCSRTDHVVAHLGEIVEWVIDQTGVAADDVDALSLPLMFAHTRALVDAAVLGWVESVAQLHPAYCRAMRGHNPPSFLVERARIDAIVAKVARKRGATRGAHGGGFAS